MRTAISFLLLLFITGIFCGCKKESPTAPVTAEDRGTALSPENEIRHQLSEMIWSPLTNEIFYSDPFKLKSVNISTKTIKVHDNSDRQLKAFSITRDQETLFYMGGDIYGSNYSLFGLNVQTGLQQKYIDSLSWYILSPVDSIAAVQLTDLRISIYNINSKSQKNIGAGKPMLFSSNGSELLYVGENDTYIYNLASDSTRSLSSQVGATGRLSPNSILYWDDSGLYSVYFYAGKLYVSDLFTKRTTLLLDDYNYYQLNTRFSPDGGKIAVWISKGEKPKPGLLSGYETYYSGLYLLDRLNGSAYRAAYGVSVEYGGGPIAFLPGGKKIAFAAFSGKIYLANF